MRSVHARKDSMSSGSGITHAPVNTNASRSCAWARAVDPLPGVAPMTATGFSRSGLARARTNEIKGFAVAGPRTAGETVDVPDVAAALRASGLRKRNRRSLVSAEKLSEETEQFVRDLPCTCVGSASGETVRTLAIF